MFYLRLIFTALRSLDAHFLRSLLATLGVLIGVASVVACMSILEGFSNDLRDRFKSLGTNLLYVTPNSAFVEGRRVGIAQNLDAEEVDALRKEFSEDVEAITGEAVGATTIKYFEKSDEYTLIACSSDFFEIYSYDATSGRIFSRVEANDESSNVICLGSEVAEKLFGGMDAVGQVVRVRNVSYRVIGVMEDKGNLGFLNADETAYIPLKAGLKRFFNRKWLNRITVLGRKANEVDDLKIKLASYLRREHGIRVGQEDDFKIYNQQEQLQNFNQVLMIWKVVFYSIAGISLLVGGIGIMNIMLVSVTERTREIGVRMAVGARRSDIMLQFLVEASIISLVGGGFGLLLGAMFADILQKVVVGFFKTQITPLVAFVAIGTATIVGIISGLYPAYKASRLDPVEALRFE